ncbi:MAG: hypothetical protein IT434_13375 [Phycisphaerales bacterium]|jgi:hypothetical protein|nr:hypothetical protein [Phycisphaerales bacterium]
MPSDAAEMPFAEFSLEVTEDHLRRFYASAVANSDEWKLALDRFRQKIRLNTWAVVIFIVAFFTVLVLVVMGVVAERFAPLLLLGAIVSAGTSALHGQQLRTQFKAVQSGDLWLKQSVESGAVGPWKIDFSDSGVRSRMRNTDATYGWEHFSAAELVPSHVAVLASQGVSMYIPIELFTSDEAARGFVRRVQSILESHACTAAHRIVAYLRDQSTPCPKCRYDLKGVQHATCPECGLALSFENVPGARGVVMPPRN